MLACFYPWFTSLCRYWVSLELTRRSLVVVFAARCIVFASIRNRVGAPYHVLVVVPQATLNCGFVLRI